MPTPEEDIPQLQLAAMRALSHPVRVRIVVALSDGAPLRTSDVAVAVGIAPNSASFHLRQLEKADVVTRVPAPPEGNRRETWWQYAHEGMIGSDPSTWAPQDREGNLQATRGMLTAAAVDMVDRLTHSIGASFDEPHRDTMYTVRTMRLTPASARRLRERLTQVFDEVVEETDEPRAQTYVATVALSPETRETTDPGA